MTAADYAGNFKQRFTIDPARAALAVIDMQYATGSRHHGLGGGSNHCLDSIAPLAGDLVMNKTTASAFRGAAEAGML